jgi:hypothetical protein
LTVASSLTLLVGVALVVVTSLRLAVLLGARTPAALLAGAYVVANAELVVVALILSAFRGFTTVSVFVALALLCAGAVAGSRRKRAGIHWRTALRRVGRDPAIAALALVAALGVAYELALAVFTPQVEDDVLTFHLVRAGLWRQHHGITYLAGIFDLRNNAYPPGGEVAPLFTLTLSGNERFVALGEMAACFALVIATVGIARRCGLSLRESAFGGLLVATLPIVLLQSGTAMSDLVVASYLAAAALFLLDGAKWSPLLAGMATALALDVKLTGPLGVPLLLAFAWFARPRERRRVRLLAVAAGTVVGAYWYAVNLVETHTWDGHVTDEFHVDRTIAAIAARIARFGIEFVDMSGAVGRDRWLYVLAALVAGAAVAAVYVRRGQRAGAIDAMVAVALTLAPLVLFRVSHGLVRAYFKTWTVLGRRDLADLDPGHDITRAASNFSWFGPLGSLALVGAGVAAILEVRRGRDRRLLLIVLAPVYWLLAFSLLFFYQEWAGRFFVLPFALAAASWGLLLRWRPAAWAVVAIAATTVLLTAANDARRPSGLALLAGHKPRSIWHTPGWRGGPETRRDYDAPVRFLAERIPAHAPVGLDVTPSDPVYPFFGATLGHRISFVGAGDRDASRADWVYVRPAHGVSLCRRAWQTAAVTAEGWRIFARRARRC